MSKNEPDDFNLGRRQFLQGAAAAPAAAISSGGALPSIGAFAGADPIALSQAIKQGSKINRLLRGAGRITHAITHLQLIMLTKCQIKPEWKYVINFGGYGFLIPPWEK